MAAVVAETFVYADSIVILVDIYASYNVRVSTWDKLSLQALPFRDLVRRKSCQRCTVKERHTVK